MISPTGHGIRNDTQGNGAYGSPRRNRKHKGTDFICVPGQHIVSPITGIVERIAYPYNDKDYSGLVISGEFISIKLFYFKPLDDIVSNRVEKGERIGYAQDISARYNPNMKPHIHMEIVSLDVWRLMEIFK